MPALNPLYLVVGQLCGWREVDETVTTCHHRRRTGSRLVPLEGDAIAVLVLEDDPLSCPTAAVRDNPITTAQFHEG